MINMKKTKIIRYAGLLLMVAAVNAPSFGQTTRSGNVRIRSSLSARQVYVGQPVRLTVSVFTTTWFTSPINLAEPHPQYAVVQTLGSTPFTRREGRITYAGVTFTYLIYPFQPGEITLPAQALTTESPPEGDFKGRPVSMQSPEPTLTVLPPPEEYTGEQWLLARQVSVRDAWNRDLAGLKVGDAFERTITTRAVGTVAALIPPPDSLAIDGLGVYPGTPTLNDVPGGRNTATRIDRITFLAQRPGAYLLPETRVTWWDPVRKQTREVTLEAVSFTVAENPDLDPDLLTAPDSSAAGTLEAEGPSVLPWRWLAGGAVGLLLLGLVALRLRRRARPGLAARRARHAESETVYFKRFHKAAASGDARAVKRHLMAWLDHAYPDEQAITTEHFTASASDPKLAEQAANLDRLLYAPDNPAESVWSGRAFYRLVAGARKRRQRRKETARPRDNDLPPLNPTKPV